MDKRNYAKWEKICQNNPDFANKYSLSMAQSKENELLCKSLVCRALAVNQSNFWSLLSPDYLEEFLEDERNHIFVKQQSDLWFHLHEQAVVTGSSCFDATGLNTLAAQKNHYRKFILKEQQEITEETAANLLSFY